MTFHACSPPSFQRFNRLPTFWFNLIVAGLALLLLLPERFLKLICDDIH